MPPAPPAKPKLSTAEAKARKAARLQSIRLQISICRELDARGITTLAEIGAEIGIPAAEATTLLNRKNLREGDLERLQAAASQLGVQVPI